MSIFPGIATLLNKMERPNCMVAVDGSVYRFHPHFHNLMMAKIAELVPPERKVELQMNSRLVDFLAWPFGQRVT